MMPGRVLLCSSFLPPFVEIATGNERAYLAIGDGTLEHPEAAVGVYVFDAVLAQHSFRAFEPTRDRSRRFDYRRFDVDDTEPDADFRPEITKHGKFVRRPVRRFEEDVIGMECVEVRQKMRPIAFLNRLAAVIP